MKPTTSPAFMLLDATMGIFICASALLLIFSYLYTIAPKPKPSNYETYQHTLLSAPYAPASLKSVSSPILIYQTQEYTYTSQNQESFRFYLPITLK